MAGDLRADVEAVAAALRAGPGQTAVVGAVDQAETAVAVLRQDLTAQVLPRLVVNIERCHRTGFGALAQARGE